MLADICNRVDLKHAAVGIGVHRLQKRADDKLLRSGERIELVVVDLAGLIVALAPERVGQNEIGALQVIELVVRAARHIRMQLLCTLAIGALDRFGRSEFVEVEGGVEVHSGRRIARWP